MDNQTTGTNYILASSIENKDNEITLKNEAPKSEYSIKNAGSKENTLRNDAPLSNRQLKKGTPAVARKLPKSVYNELKKEAEEPEEKKDSMPHKTVNELGKITWNKTHFIFGIEAGGNTS